MIKVAHIGGMSLSKPHGGIDFLILELSKRLYSYGVVTFFWARDPSCQKTKDLREFQITEMPLFRLKSETLEPLLNFPLASFQAALSDVDIVHYHTLFSGIFSFIPEFFGKKVIITRHTFEWRLKERSKFAQRILKMVNSLFLSLYHKKLIAISLPVYNYYRKRKQKVLYIPNGVSLPKKITQKRERYLLFCSRLVPGKGIEYLIKAFNDFVKSRVKLNRSYKLCICGTGEKDYVDKLKRIATKNVIFQGYVSGGKKHELFRKASIYVLPSEVEGMSVSLLEAMSYGIPVLVSDIQENKDVVLKNGFYFKTNDTESLRKTLAYMVRNPAELREKAINARSFVSHHFNLDVITKKYYVLYNEMLDKDIKNSCWEV